MGQMELVVVQPAGELRAAAFLQPDVYIGIVLPPDGQHLAHVALDHLGAGADVQQAAFALAHLGDRVMKALAGGKDRLGIDQRAVAMHREA